MNICKVPNYYVKLIIIEYIYMNYNTHNSEQKVKSFFVNIEMM